MVDALLEMLGLYEPPKPMFNPMMMGGPGGPGGPPPGFMM